MLPRVIATALTLMLMLSIGIFSAFAQGDTSVVAPAGKVLIQETSYNIVPGVVETDVFLNSSEGTGQTAGFMTTISPSANVTIKASYSGYYTADSTAESRKEYAGTVASEWKWSLENIIDQAEAYESVTGGNVVAATNGDYYNMQTAQPLGCLIMEGNVVQGAHEPYFAVLKDGSYVIRDANTDCSDVLEAVSGPFLLVDGGELTANATNNKANPVNSIGLKADGTVVMFQVDGRQSPYSSGMTLYELASFLKSQGVVRALYLDGGGSASYASQREGETELQMRGVPSDGVIRDVASALLIVSTEEDSNTFDHARVEPAGGIYEKGSSVQFSAVGVSSSGASAQMPDNCEWAVADESCGSIDENGLFTANADFEGTATIKILSDGQEIGQASIEISDIGKLCFTNGTEKLDLSQFGAGWIQLGNDVYHFDETGHAHSKASMSDTRTCTKYGPLKYTCPDCGEVFSSGSIWPKGHDWDENHVCTKCGKQGTDISTCTINVGSVEFNGSSSVVGVSVYNGDTRLTIKSSEVSSDGYILYGNCTSVGYGKITIKGCGDYYGTLSATYKIVPASVATINVGNITENGVTLSWSSSAGAQAYWLSYSNDGGTTWKNVKTTDTSITLNNLDSDTEYSFRVFATAKVNGESFNSRRYSSIATAYIHAHVTELQNAKDASCTEDGYTGDEVCTVCGETIVSGKTIPAAHKIELQNAKTATCTEDGYTGDEVCTVCGETIVSGKTIPAAHKIEIQNAKTATCTEDGYTGDEICTVCGETISKGTVIEALGHKEVVDPAVAATCTTDGKTEGKHCSVCEAVIVAQETIPALDHKTEVKNAKAATCTEDGYTGDEICTVCNKTIKTGEVIKALDHKTELQNAKAATCTEDGYTGDEVCTVCGETIKTGEVIKALGHKEVVDPAVAATCTTAGKTEGKHCSVCEAVIAAQETIPALGHSYKNGVCTVCGSADPGYKSNPFVDVKDDAYYNEAVQWAVNHDPAITDGVDATHFAPTADCTRAQAVTFLWRSAGCPTPTTKTCAFTDVKEGTYYYEAVLWAVEKGITDGTSATTFSPNEKVTRAQVVTFLYRMEGQPKVENTTCAFTDIDTNAYYYNAVLWAVANGITDGMDATHFAPTAVCNRAQIVTFIFRYDKTQIA